MKRKKKFISPYRPPLWFPLWVMEEKSKKKAKEQLSELERDVKRERIDSAQAARESRYSIAKGSKSSAEEMPLFRQIRQREHMRLTRRVQEQPQLFPEKPVLTSPMPSRIPSPRFTPPCKPFVPLQERLKK